MNTLRWLLVLLAVYRFAYHATYVSDSAFAWASFSDGAVYEAMANDILASPPWGTRPFYLQGAYAYFMAWSLSVGGILAAVVVAQVMLAAGVLWLFFRSAVTLWGKTAGALSTICLLAYPALAFYENKFLSAELGVACNVFALWCFVRMHKAGPSKVKTLAFGVGLGVASGLCLLARPNMMLAIPWSLAAVVWSVRRLGRAWVVVGGLGFVVGVLLAIAPMAYRNHQVTGSPDVGPVHGGGTSFYIGNNPDARGVWNHAGLLSGRLGTEAEELALQLGIEEHEERARAVKIGDALYRRSFAWIAAHPRAWLALEVKKMWLVIGNDEITQDYDWYGEREIIPWAHRIGVPFAALLGLGVLGLASLLMRPREHVGREEKTIDLPVLLFLMGQWLAPLAANLLFFTSSQHRLPLVIPLALLSGPGIIWGLRRWKKGASVTPYHGVVLALAGVLVVQGYWPRLKSRTPHPIHYYNLAYVLEENGEPLLALDQLDRAIELRPQQMHFLLRRAKLRGRLGDSQGATSDFHRLLELDDLPVWLTTEAERSLASLDTGR